MNKQEYGRKLKRKPLGYNKRTEEQRAFDIAYCSKLFLRGYSYREIAEALNRELPARGCNYTISFQMVYYDLQQCLIEWKRERFDNIDEYITQELKKLDRIERELWTAWENSKKDKSINVSRSFRRGVGSTEERTETSAGNPKFLDLLLNVQQRRAKMLGFDAPVKIDIPGVNRSGGATAPEYDVTVLPDEMLFAVADKLQEAEYNKVMETKAL